MSKSDDLRGWIQDRGWPLTKASYIAAMYYPEAPDFPLDGEIVSRVPRGLPGKLPTSPMDLLFRDRTSSPQGEPSKTSPFGRPQPPESLVDSVMRRHGFSREQALEELEKTLL